MDVKTGNMVLKGGVNMEPAVVGRCIPALAGVGSSYCRSE
jgi:hypothetical protein